MLKDLGLRINDVLQQRFGVDVPTASDIIFESGQDAQLISEWRYGGGVLQFVTGGTLAVETEKCRAAGAKRIELVVFDEVRDKYTKGTEKTHPKVKARYPIR